MSLTHHYVMNVNSMDQINNTPGNVSHHKHNRINESIGLHFIILFCDPAK